MNKEDMILISVDDHIVEPPDMFKNHLQKKYLDEAPRLVHNPDGSDTWQFRDIVIPNVALNAVAGRPKEEYGLEPQGLDEIRPGCYKVDERVKDMNAGGILGSMCFPSFPGFAGPVVRHRGSGVLPGAGAGLQRLACRGVVWGLSGAVHPDDVAGDLGRRGVRGRGSAQRQARGALVDVHARIPSAMGYPSFHDFDYWKPMWDALVDTDTVLNVHIGSSGRLAITAPDAPMDVMITLQPMNIVQAAADLLWSKPIKEYPDLKIALSEGGTGWIPYFLERADRTYEMHSTWTGQDFGKQKPSGGVPRSLPDVLHLRSRRRASCATTIGIDNICWEADYPHSDSMWPGAPEQLDEVLKKHNVTDVEINKMTYENAMRWYHWDPFTHITKEQATVGALRKAAEGHDVSIQALSKHEHGGANFADFAANAKELTGNKD